MTNHTDTGKSVREKSASISTWITDNTLNIVALTETWHDSVDSPQLIACAPDGYHYVERARPRSESEQLNEITNHGDVCLLFSNHLRARPSCRRWRRLKRCAPTFFNRTSMRSSSASTGRARSQQPTRSSATWPSCSTTWLRVHRRSLSWAISTSTSTTPATLWRTSSTACCQRTATNSSSTSLPTKQVIRLIWFWLILSYWLTFYRLIHHCSPIIRWSSLSSPARH